MATDCSFLSEDQFLCSICLDVFTEPVSIPCGHNFCKACITRHWEGREQRQCPLCNEKFDKGLKLRVNTGFREIVEIYKEQSATAAKNCPVKPGQVPCDCCLSNKLKASKTCLVCLASYCETHLEPHLRVAALKRHTLTNPVHNLEDQICKKHNRMLELFCLNDQVSVCALCTEHSTHVMVPLEEVCADKRAQKGKKKVQIQETKQRRGKSAQKMKRTMQTKRKDKDEAMANSELSNEVQGPHVWWFQHQFNRCGCVPGDLSNRRVYHEVHADGSCGIGEVRESLRGARAFVVRNGNWVIRIGSDTNSMAPYQVPIHRFRINKPENVIVFVDYDNGSVFFFDADTSMLAFTVIGCKFHERMYQFYRPDNIWVQRLKEMVQKIKEWSQLPDAMNFLICVACFFVFVFICIVSIYFNSL